MTKPQEGEQVHSYVVEFAKQLELPGEIHEHLHEGFEKVLMVATSGFKKILCFPAPKGVPVVRIKLFLDEQGLNPAFFTALGELTKKNDLQSVYNTGICTKETACFWEGYFWFNGEQLDHATLEEALAKITNVVGVELQEMQSLTKNE